MLLTYNKEDCENLKGLTDRLRNIIVNAARLPDVRFADSTQSTLTEAGTAIVDRFSEILQSAHGAYEYTKIILRAKEEDQFHE